MKSLRELFSSSPGGAPEGMAEADDGTSLFPLDAATPSALITAFGISADGLDAALDRALATLPARYRLVCVTDQPDFLPLRRRGVSFEYLVPPSLRGGIRDAAAWRTYLTERYEILLAKWRPTQIVAVGTSLEQFLGGDGQ
jgi:hypothetical protein